MFGISDMEFLTIIAGYILIIAVPVVIVIYIIRRIRKTNNDDDISEASLTSSPDFTDNQRKILKMIQQKKITIDDGEKLLSEIHK